MCQGVDAPEAGKALVREVHHLEVCVPLCAEGFDCGQCLVRQREVGGVRLHLVPRRVEAHPSVVHVNPVPGVEGKTRVRFALVGQSKLGVGGQACGACHGGQQLGEVGAPRRSRAPGWSTRLPRRCRCDSSSGGVRTPSGSPGRRAFRVRVQKGFSRCFESSDDGRGVRRLREGCLKDWRRRVGSDQPSPTYRQPAGSVT